MSALANIQHQIQRVDEVLASLNHRMATEQSRTLVLQIRALEKEQLGLREEFEREALTASMDVCRYVVSESQPTIRGLSTVLMEFQELFTTIYKVKAGLIKDYPEKKRGRKKKVDKPATLIPEPQLPEFGFGYSFPGSTGIALTLPSMSAGALFSDPKMDDSFDSIVEISRADSPAEVSRIAKHVGARSIEAMHRWTRAHTAFGYGVDIQWKGVGGHEVQIRLQKEQVEKLTQDLSQTTIDTSVESVGTLIAVESDVRRFRFDADDGTLVEGSYTDAITEEHAASVPARYTAHFLKSVAVVSEEGEEPKRMHTLLRLEPV